jgi:hypothetical protein
VELSTILDVLRKAQEEARQKSAPAAVPGSLLDTGARRKRRRWVWTAIAGIVAGGFAGGWWIGSRPYPRPSIEVASSELPAAAEAPEGEAAPAPPAARGPDAVPGAGAADSQPAPAAAPAPPPPPATAARPGVDAARAALLAARRAAGSPAAGPPGAGDPKGAVDAEGAVALAGDDPGVPAVVGERRPPAYIEQRSGPDGPEPPRLRTIPRPGRGPIDGGAAGLPAPVRVPPAPPAGAAAVVPGSFRDAAAVRVGDSEARPVVVRRRSESADEALEGEEAVEGAGDATSLAAVAPARLPPPSAPDADGLAGALRRSPSGAPEVTINIVQWSATPARRFAYVRVDGSQMVQVHEGDTVGGLTVKRIFQQAVEFAHGEGSFVLRAN